MEAEGITDHAIKALKIFEVSAETYLDFVTNMDNQDRYTSILLGLGNTALAQATGYSPGFVVFRGGTDFEKRLKERLAFWSNEAYKRLIVPTEKVTSGSTSGSDDEIDRRTQLLTEYKAATGNPSNRSIYEARNSGIHKPEFYAWLRGELAFESATTRSFERFLRDKKPPIPKNSKP